MSPWENNYAFKRIYSHDHLIRDDPVYTRLRNTTTTKMLRNVPLQWRHNDNDGVSNHQPHGRLFNRLFRRRSKKTSKLRVTGLCVGNSPEPVNSPHKGPVTRKMFPFDDVIMRKLYCIVISEIHDLYSSISHKICGVISNEGVGIILVVVKMKIDRLWHGLSAMIFYQTQEETAWYYHKRMWLS